MLKQINSFSYGVFVILISTCASKGKCRPERKKVSYAVDFFFPPIMSHAMDLW